MTELLDGYKSNIKVDRPNHYAQWSRSTKCVVGRCIPRLRRNEHHGAAFTVGLWKAECCSLPNSTGQNRLSTSSACWVLIGKPTSTGLCQFCQRTVHSSALLFTMPELRSVVLLLLSVLARVSVAAPPHAGSRPMDTLRVVARGQDSESSPSVAQSPSSLS